MGGIPFLLAHLIPGTQVNVPETRIAVTDTSTLWAHTSRVLEVRLEFFGPDFFPSYVADVSMYYDVMF